ncbi:acylphosphatase [soil metagenome]|jgi:acylphosphatase
MENDRERAHVYVSGNVQGVFFRDSTRQKAEELGLLGWVKNTPDGRVEAVFEGPTEDVRKMVDWCENGPSQADVEDVEAEYDEAEGEPESFEVR